MSINKPQKYNISGRKFKGKLEQKWETAFWYLRFTKGLDVFKDVFKSEDKLDSKFWYLPIIKALDSEYKLDLTFVIYKLMVNFDVTAIDAENQRPIVIDNSGNSNDHLFGIEEYRFDQEEIEHLENEDHRLILEYMIDSGIISNAYKERDLQKIINRLNRRLENINTILAIGDLESHQESDLMQREADIEKRISRLKNISQKNDLPNDVVNLIKEAKPEIERIYKAIKKVSFSKKIFNAEEQWRDAALKELNKDKGSSGLIKDEHLSDKKMYFFAGGQERRDFIKSLLSKIIEPKYTKISKSKLYHVYKSLK